jgi:hypothetical protein
MTILESLDGQPGAEVTCELLAHLADKLNGFFNTDAHGDQIGFCLVLFKRDEPEIGAEYLANIADALAIADMLRALGDQIQTETVLDRVLEDRAEQKRME